MEWLQQTVRAAAVASAALLGLPGPAVAQATEEEAAEADRLLGELAEPGREDWQRIEAELTRLWSRSGSEAMDLLLRRGTDALEAEDYALAVEHLTALTDHAPEFAEGWNARATAFFMLDEYALAMADVRRTLALNPRHFGALAGAGIMLEQMGEYELALRAMRAAEEINPNRPNVGQAVLRLERMTGAAEL